MLLTPSQYQARLPAGVVLKQVKSGRMNWSSPGREDWCSSRQTHRRLGCGEREETTWLICVHGGGTARRWEGVCGEVRSDQVETRSQQEESEFNWELLKDWGGERGEAVTPPS